jgi:hypothetical protein
MLVYDPLLGRYLAFGTLKTAALGKVSILLRLAIEADDPGMLSDKTNQPDAARPCCKLGMSLVYVPL